MTDRPPAERAGLEHNPKTCHICMNPNLHGEQAPDPLELENDRLRASIEGITATLDATVAAFAREREALQAKCDAERKEREVWAARARDYCKSWDDSRAAADRLQTVAFQAQNAAIDLAQQVATLTAERDVARAEAATVDAQRRGTVAAIPEIAARERANEREGCAQLANWHLNNIERLRPSANDGWLKGYRDACADLETAIRARGAK